MKESKSMIKKEVAFMKAKGAPKSMIKHEQAEAKAEKAFAKGGGVSRGVQVAKDAVAKGRAQAAPAGRSFSAPARLPGSPVGIGMRGTASAPAFDRGLDKLAATAAARAPAGAAGKYGSTAPAPSASRAATPSPAVRPVGPSPASAPPTPNAMSRTPAAAGSGMRKMMKAGGSVDGCASKGKTKGSVR